MPAATAAPVRNLQGVEVPAEAINAPVFMQLTRRHRIAEKSAVWNGNGMTDTIELLKSDILSEIRVRLSGSVTVTPGTGTVATSARWPHDVLRTCNFTANGQSNLVNCGGLKLKALQFIRDPKLTDRGVAQSVGGSSVNQGTLSLGSDTWGLGSSQSAIAAGTYNFELEWVVPIAEDHFTLAGAIFLATTSTDLTLKLGWATLADLFVLTGNATVAMTGTFTVETEKFSIPVVNGQMIVPDLSLFHSIIEGRTTRIGDEIRLPGQGIGKSLLRAGFQVWNGSPSAPLQLSATNFGSLYWRYANNETPDTYPDGRSLRQRNEMDYNTDLGALWGFGIHEFAAHNAFRDAVDEGTTSDLRLGINLQNSVTQTSPAIEYFHETMFLAGQGA